MSNHRYFRSWTWVCENVSKEVFGRDQISSKNSKSFWNSSWGRTTIMHYPSKDEGTLGIEWAFTRHKESWSLVWNSTVVTASCMGQYGTWLQNATDIITKCNSYFIRTCNKSLLQNNKIIIRQLYYKMCDVYYKVWQSSYKMQYLFQNVTFI